MNTYYIYKKLTASLSLNGPNQGGTSQQTAEHSVNNQSELYVGLYVNIKRNIENYCKDR